MKQYLLPLVMLAFSSQSFAHAPYVAPNSYIVQGEQTAIFAAFAEEAFDAEYAISGFDFSVLSPQAERQILTLSNDKAVSSATVITPQDGTYQVIGQRKSNLKYALLGKRWLKVIDVKSSDLPPLAQRSFALPSEVSAKNKQKSVERFEEISSFFSKNKTTALQLDTNPKGLSLRYSTHPNQLSSKTPLLLGIQLNAKPVAGLDVRVEKQLTRVGEKTEAIQLQSDAKGQVSIVFPSAGQYVITVSTAEPQEQQQPASQSYRSIVTVWVND